MKPLKILICLAVFFAINILAVNLVLAQTPVIGPDNPEQIGGSTEGQSLQNPLGDEQGDISKVANNIIKGVLGLVGVLALVAFIWGGIDWLTSAGNEARIKKGKDMMIWAVIGLVAIFGSYAILNVIFQALGS